MISELQFDTCEVISAVRNITTFDDVKSYITTITMVKSSQHSFVGLTGLERELKELHLSNENELIKVSSTYSVDSNGNKILPAKVLFKFKTDVIHREVAYYENEITEELFDDIDFIDKMFDESNPLLKRVY